MSVRLRITLILVGLVGFFAAIHYGVERIAIAPRFADLQRAEAVEDLDRCIKAIDGEVLHLSTMARDWAAWDDTYQFVIDRNAAYVECNLLPEAFTTTQSNVLYVYDLKGRLVWGECRELKTLNLVGLEELSAGVMGPDHWLVKHESPDSSIAGVLLTGLGPLLVSSQPIVTSGNGGPVRGSLVMGRFLNEEMLENIAEKLSVEFEVERLDRPEICRQYASVLERVSGAEPYVEDASNDVMNVYVVMEDVEGRPALLVKAGVPKSIIAKGRTAILFSSLSVLIGAAVVIVATYLLLDKTVLSRLAALSKTVDAIEGCHDLSARTSVVGNNELGRLGVSFNRMLEQLECTGQKIVAAKREWERTFDTVPDLIAITNSDGKILRANKAMAEKFGLTPAQIIGAQCCKYFHGTDCQSEACTFKKLLDDGRSRCGEVFNEQFGQYFDVCLSPVHDKNGEIIGSVHVARDITDYKHIEQELRESDQKYRTIFDSALDSIIIIDGQAKVVDANPAACRMYGYTQEELVGTDSLKLVHPDYQHIAETFTQDVLSTGQFCGEAVEVQKDGSTFHVEARGRVILIDGEHYALAVMRDVTEHKKAEQKLTEAMEKAESASEAKSQFLANMSHEIRTPMNAIMGFSDIIANQELSDEQHQYIQIIRDSARNLLQVIGDILDLSRIEAGKLDVELKCCDLGVLVRSVESMVGGQAGEKGLDLKVVRGPDVPAMIRTDPSRLRQCLINLLGNAIKFTERGRVSLEVSVQETEGAEVICFEVEDTGPGIPLEKQQAIFDGFTQADESTTRRYGGPGLGLTITKHLVELLGGSISLSSEVGKGSKFTLMLAADAVTNDASESQCRQAESTGNNSQRMWRQFSGRALVVEDCRTNQILLKTMLEKSGFEVDIAPDGAEAIGRVHSCSYDIILMDMQMPGVSGYEAAETLRADGVTTPIIAVTAHAMADDRAKCIAAGCDDYLSKPVDRSRLFETLARYVPSEAETSGCDATGDSVAHG